MKYAKFDLGQIEAILNMLGGEDGAKRFLAGKTKVVSKEFEVWKTIKLGTLKSVGDLPKQMGPYKSGSPEILWSPAFTLAPQEMEVDLVICTPFELGFKDELKSFPPGVATLRQVYSNACMCGLQLCPAEVGPQLHLQWTDRVANQGVSVGMEPISLEEDDGGQILEVGTNFHGQYLNSSQSGHLDNTVFSRDCQFVFIKPRKS